ncbi:hypothetical protein OIY81_2011 [Cryptosporidium canis]|uniref:Uncharacterized protein n=1 Tax=Cryptosporidium canis TaxID=195482 RepID=A0ABQ8P9N0_9CRYT|nr:hypothetical protein OIY81_2011 [Cryptosporidium canis]KAJ1613836.1 hypothetical protein OJ252_868 [Cryptosporidium canis]
MSGKVRDNVNNRSVKITVPDSTLRRTDSEVRELVISLKERIFLDHELVSRLRYFWPTNELQEQLLFSICKDIPRNDNPVEDASHFKLQFMMDPSKYGGAFNECCEWLGPINKFNYCPAVKVHLPNTYEPWITYTSNILAYLFGKISGCESPSSFLKMSAIKPNEPFEMSCGNRKCIRISHIVYKDGMKGYSVSEKVNPYPDYVDIDEAIKPSMETIDMGGVSSVQNQRSQSANKHDLPSEGVVTQLHY